MDLFSPISEISRVGPVYQKRLKKLGIKTVRDLLFHFPSRYEDYSHILPISKLAIGQTACIQGKVLEIKNIRTFKRRLFITKAIVSDNSGAIKVTWFNQPYLTKTLKINDTISLIGTVVSNKNETYLANPSYEKIAASEDQENNGSPLIHTGRLVPVYPETARLSSRWLRYIIRGLLITVGNRLPETIPLEILKENQFLPIRQALWQVHFPDSLNLANQAKKRFSFENLFHISLLVLRERRRLNREKAIPVAMNLGTIQDFVGNLPFKLTDAQRKASWTILKDLEKPRPMNRLLQGDVGSGKTVVAMIAALNMIKAGYQVALMAPTEILAKQHFQQFELLLRGHKVDIGLLTGKEDKFYSKKLKNQTIEVSKKKLLEKAEDNEINILIGTHALIQKEVLFGNLALVILDEQHRFGVEQRAKLCRHHTTKEKRPIPHLLSMTATPIPRTLALTIYGDLDLSLIDQMPKERKKIRTEIVPPKERKRVYSFIRKEIKKGRKAFVICPRIEPSKDKSQLDAELISENPKEEKTTNWTEAKAVKEEYEKLAKEVFPDLKVGILHGKIGIKEKERTMRDFRGTKIDILVSTSVVEVGIDIPNATVMMIEGSEHFGLAQLHQFRGRVGRSKYQSYCFVLTDSPSLKTKKRLEALIDCDNGFELAERDLALRGPGEFFGQRQWGIPDSTMSSLKDIHLVERVRQTANDFLDQDPDLKKHPLLKKGVEDFRKIIHLE
ncbi:MAG: ATP-dependent DNA helicase RecG [bacterium]